MNNQILDLHGMTELEATPQILIAIFSLEEKNYDYIEIITGNGYVLKRVVEELLEDYKLNWEHINGNQGSYIIRR